MNLLVSDISMTFELGYRFIFLIPTHIGGLGDETKAAVDLVYCSRNLLSPELS